MRFPSQKPANDIINANVPNKIAHKNKLLEVNFIVVPAIRASILVAMLRLNRHFSPMQVILDFSSFANASNKKFIPKIKKIPKTRIFEYGARYL